VKDGSRPEGKVHAGYGNPGAQAGVHGTACRAVLRRWLLSPHGADASQAQAEKAEGGRFRSARCRLHVQEVEPPRHSVCWAAPRSGGLKSTRARVRGGTVRKIWT